MSLLPVTVRSQSVIVLAFLSLSEWNSQQSLVLPLERAKELLLNSLLLPVPVPLLVHMPCKSLGLRGRNSVSPCNLLPGAGLEHQAF